MSRRMMTTQSRSTFLWPLSSQNNKEPIQVGHCSYLWNWSKITPPWKIRLWSWFDIDRKSRILLILDILKILFGVVNLIDGAISTLKSDLRKPRIRWELKIFEFIWHNFVFMFGKELWWCSPRVIVKNSPWPIFRVNAGLLQRAYYRPDNGRLSISMGCIWSGPS